MLKTLLASKPTGKTLKKKGWAVSLSVHAAVLLALAAVAGKDTLMPMLTKPKAQNVVFTQVQPPPPPPPKVEPIPEKPRIAPKAPPAVKRAAPIRQYTAPVVKEAPRLAPAPTVAVAPAAVAVNIPAVGDVLVKPTEAPPAGPPSEGTSKGVATTDDARGSPTGGLNSGEALTGEQVEREVQALVKPVMRYPESMRAEGVEGAVAIQFVVGANGRVEPGSFQVLSTPHASFVEVVKRALLAARYRPAEFGGKTVRQLVQQSFAFRLDKDR